MKKFLRLFITLLIFSILLFPSCNDSSDVVNPGEPSNPTKPVKPSEPTNPDNPNKPTAPSKPTNPTDPTDPSEPDPIPDPTPDPDPDPPKPAEKTFSVDKESLEFSGEGESLRVNITSDYEEEINLENADETNFKAELNGKVLTITANENTIWPRSTKIKLSVSDKTITISASQKSNPNVEKHSVWLSGITPPNKDELECTTQNKPQQNWFETTSTEWFNIKKTATGSGGDSNMCYAMSAANMLHWWFYKNPNFVNDYIAKKKAENPNFDDTLYHPTYIRTKNQKDFFDEWGDDFDTASWQAYESEKSSIAKFLRNNFYNSSVGGDVAGVLNYMLLGRDTPSLKSDDKWNLFGDVMSIDDHVVEPAGLKGLTIVEFKNIIAPAVAKGEAIGINYGLLKNEVWTGALHEVSCYGYIEDKFGNVIGLWLNDNNQEETGVVSYGLYPTKDSNGDYRINLTNLSSGDFGALGSSMAYLNLITILHNKDNV